MNTLRLLLVEDSEADAELVVYELTRGGFSVDAMRVASRETLLSALGNGAWDLAIADCSMPGFSGPAALNEITKRAPEMPFIFVSGTLDEAVAAALMKRGACDYVVKGNLTRLVPAVQRELRHAASRRDQRRAEQRLAHLAFHDPLTGLPNRALFRDALKHAMHRARREGDPVTLLVLDLDRFKEINDTLGHLYGDRVLKEVSHRLRSLVRDGDTVARLGGDEFGMVLSSMSVQDAWTVARRLVEELSRPIVVGHQTLSIRPSVGMAQFPDHAAALELLVQRADFAMYAAKAEATGIAVYDQTRDRRTHRRLALARELRRAIEREELVVEYQPILQIATGAITAVESLVRWDHPRYGRLYPDEFISIAEQGGMITDLTRAVLNKAISHWGTTSEIGLAVNLSPRCAEDLSLSHHISGLLRSQNLPASRLTLEITESVVMSDEDQLVQPLTHLHGMGVRLSVDDFGTGYSSLKYLTHFPVDELKIDRSFVADLAVGNEVIVRSTIDLAHNLGLSVVAEGVDSPAILERLRALGCDAAQGTLVSQPLAADALLRRLAEPVGIWQFEKVSVA